LANFEDAPDVVIYSKCTVTFETDRLTLRPFTSRDVAEAIAIYANPENMRFIPGGPWTEQRTSELIERFSVHARERGYGLLAVRERRSLRLIGHCGLNTIAETAEIEVAYLIDRPFWGRGIATEAAAAVVADGFTRAGVARIIGLTMPENIASRRVLAKLSMKTIGEAEYFRTRMIVHELFATS
jgi:RimJ/RimL family protein N-acetyltransferase